jgi:integrase
MIERRERLGFAREPREAIGVVGERVRQDFERYLAIELRVTCPVHLNGKRSLGDVERRITLHLMPYFGGLRMSAVTTATIRSYVAERQDKGAENATINRELSIVKRAFRLASQAGKLLYVPHVPMLREDNVRTGFFERDEFEAVRSALPEPLRGVVAFAYLTGWRIRSEVLPLHWSQVDRSRKTIRLEPGTTKNSDGRTLPYDLLPDLVDVLDDQWKAHEQLTEAGTICPFVFHRQGAPIKAFKKSWTLACTAAGYPGKIPHDFRRTAVRNLVRAGVPEKTAMMITGHKTRSVFDRYDIVNEADLRTAIGKLADATGTKKGQSQGQGRVASFGRRRKRDIS